MIQKSVSSSIILMLCLIVAGPSQISGQAPPPETDPRLYDIINAVSADRIEQDIQKLVSFGTRHTLSDTVSDTRGIGAARRWIRDEFERISAACGGCLEIYYEGEIVPAEGNRRIPKDTRVVNVYAIQRGKNHPNRFIMMSGDIDSRVSDPVDGTSDSPGANDNASGVAGTLEAARVLSQYEFNNSIIYTALSGEEQGLLGGKILASKARERDWDIIGILNNDMIGNIKGVDGTIDNRTYRIFSQAVPVTDDERMQIWRRFYGGEVDGPSRQLARYIASLSEAYMPLLNPMLIYRLDRFGRGGHHKPFNDAGYPGVRIMEAHENYNQQHQDIRVEDGIEYGDVIDHVNFAYAASLTSVNAITLASLAWAPPPPQDLMIGGAVQPSTQLSWDAPEGADNYLAGYRIYWRKTSEPQWEYSRYVGKLTDFTLEGIVIDNYLFGVVSVSGNGHESLVQFPVSLLPRKR